MLVPWVFLPGGSGEVHEVARPPRFRLIALKGLPPWTGGISLGLLCLAAGLWGYFTEDPGKQSAIEALAYFWLPVLVLCLVLASLGRRPAFIMAAVALLDVEAALLGAGPQIALPFVVAVPLIGVAVAGRMGHASRQRAPYVAAWLSSSIGVTIAVSLISDGLASSTIVVIPAFMFVDAVALYALWRLDSGRLKALGGAAEAEARVLDLLNGVELIAVHMDPDARIDFMNDFALQLTGWTREEVIGKDWWDTFATADRREERRRHFHDIVAERRVMERHRESSIITKSGDVRLIRWSHVTRRSPDGQVTGVASLGEDITAVRAAEDAARRGAEMLSRLVVSSPLPTVVMDMDRTVQLWNPAAAELLGWPEAEVIGRPFPAAMYADDRWAIGRTFVRAKRGQPLDHELIGLRTRDGAAITVKMYGGLLLDGIGRPRSVGLQAVDMTQALAIEDQLREAQKMEAVGRLAGGVAHDFNNSLTAIGGFASLIAAETAEPETREAAETILGAARRAADLTRELLAYSRRSLLQPQTIDVNELVGAVRPMLLRLLGEDVSVAIEAGASEAMVRVDPGGLERVILNLAANARDAMPDGGRLTISTERRAADDSGGNGHWVAISVADTGAGIPAELHSQVFDPFFTTKPVGSGTGLGLAMVKGFVVQSGGQVALKSRPGLGTVIEILLPEIVDARKPAAAGAAPAIVGGDETILVVEDEPAVAALSFQFLSRRGYRVLLADSGQSAIALLRGHPGPIALLLVDVILPDIRGPQLVEAARAIHPESAVLFASGYSTEDMGRRGELPDGVDLIEKPFAPEHLLARVRAAIDRGSSKTSGPKGPA
jgi:two-component system, cell cycle sensor histidine kinase and response regulator CckA